MATSRDGTSALAAIRSGAFGAVVLDPFLPEMDGYEILALLQSDGQAHPPIILRATSNAREDVARGLALGAAAYFIKSRFTPREILASILPLIRES